MPGPRGAVLFERVHPNMQFVDTAFGVFYDVHELRGREIVEVSFAYAQGRHR